MTITDIAKKLHELKEGYGYADIVIYDFSSKSFRTIGNTLFIGG